MSNLSLLLFDYNKNLSMNEKHTKKCHTIGKIQEKKTIYGYYIEEFVFSRLNNIAEKRKLKRHLACKEVFEHPLKVNGSTVCLNNK